MAVGILYILSIHCLTYLGALILLLHFFFVDGASIQKSVYDAII